MLTRPWLADPRRIVKLTGWWIGLATIVSFVIYMTDSLELTRWLFWLFIPSIYFYLGPCFGLLLNLAEPRMRAVFCASTLFVANVGNLIVAPVGVGLLSDLFSQRGRLQRAGESCAWPCSASCPPDSGRRSITSGRRDGSSRTRCVRPACRSRAHRRTRMKLKDIKTFVVGNPPPHFGGRYFVFVKLTTDDNVSGIGEAYCVPFHPDLVAKMIEDVFGRYLEGQDPHAIETMWRRVYSSGFTQHPDLTLMGVLSALEMACWDIVGKAANSPIYQLLGGKVHERLRSYTYIYPRPEQDEGVYKDPDLSAERAAEYLQQGFTAIKFDPAGPYSAFDGRQLSLEALELCEEFMRSAARSGRRQGGSAVRHAWADDRGGRDPAGATPGAV